MRMSRSQLEFCCVDGWRGLSKPYAMLKARRKTFIREWRSHRHLTQEQLAERVDMSPGNLSLIERGLQNYTQDTLESLANALQCDPADLLMRNPLDAEAIWSIWDRAKPGERRMIVDIAKTITKTGT
jgi:transcriptional regulator with XRE-family HTH domain